MEGPGRSRAAVALLVALHALCSVELTGGQALSLTSNTRATCGAVETDPAVLALYHEECNATDLEVWTALPLDISRVGLPSRNLIVHGYTVNISDYTAPSRNITIYAKTIQCGKPSGAITVSLTGTDPQDQSHTAPANNCTVAGPGQPTVGCNGTAGAHATVLIAPAGGSITFFAEEFLCPGVDLSVRTAGARGSRGQDGGAGFAGQAGRNGVNWCGSNKDFGRCNIDNPRGEDGTPAIPGGRGGAGGMSGLPGPGGDANYNFYRSTRATTIPTNQSIGTYPGLTTGGAGTASVKGGAGGHGGYVVYNKLRPKCSTTTRCFGKTYPDAPASPPGAQGFYYPGTLRPAALHDYHGSLELTPYLSSEQLTMILDQGNSAFSSQQYSVAIPFFNFVQNVTRTCNLVPRPAAVFASQFGPDSDDLTELATIDDSTAYYIAPDVLSDTNAYEAANNDTGDLLGADQGEAALDFYGSPYSNLPNCASLNAQANTSLAQMAAGIDFYGNALNWVPLIGLDTLLPFIDTILPIAQSVEDQYKAYFAAAQDAAKQRQQITALITSNSALIESLNKQIGINEADVVSIQADLFTLNTNRNAAKDTLQQVGETFRAEIQRKLQLEKIGDIFGAITSIATAAKDGFGNIEALIKTFTGDQKGGSCPGNCPDWLVKFIGQISGLAGSGLSTYNKIAADDVKIAKAETFKIFVDNTEWDNFIVSFKDLPGYPNYSTALIAYKTACSAVSDKALQLTALYTAIANTQALVFATANSTAMARDFREGNPATVFFSTFFGTSYKAYLQTLQKAYYQSYQVYNYYTLSSTRPQATINTVLGIRTAVGQLKTDLVAAATRQGRGPQAFPYGSHLEIVINEANTPGFKEGLRQGNITFFLDVNKNYFRLAAQVLVSSAGIYFEGAKAFPGPKQNNIFAMTMRHNGSPVFKGTNGVTQRFSHRRRNTVFSYNLQTNETDIVGDLTGGSCATGVSCPTAFIGLSPYSYWTVFFNASSADLTEVKSLSMSFAGTFLPFDHLSALEAAGGLPVIPDFPAHEDENITLTEVVDGLTAPLGAPTNLMVKPFTWPIKSQTSNLTKAVFDDCSNTTLTVTVNPTADAEANYNFGYLLDSNGSLPFDLGPYNGTAEFTAVPATTLKAACKGPSGLYAEAIPSDVEPFSLGSAKFGPTSDGDIYEASVKVSQMQIAQLQLAHPSLTGHYSVLVNITNADGGMTGAYLDDIDSCATRRFCNVIQEGFQG